MIRLFSAYISIAATLVLYSFSHYAFAQLHSCYEYNMSAYVQDSSQRASLKEIKRELFKVRKFQLTNDASYNFKLKFYNLTNLDEFDFTSKVMEQTEMLNSCFFATSMSIDEDDPYFERVDTAKIAFKLNSTNLAYQPNPLIWDNWDGFKFQSTDGINPDPTLIHIWVVDLPEEKYSYASTPNGKSDTEGIVINSKHFANSIDENYNEGKTLCFLMGVFFGLEPLTGTHACADDGVMDTPKHYKQSTCEMEEVSQCENAPYMIHNIMTHSSDSCKKYFTKGQVYRMKYFIEHCPSLQQKI